MSGKNIWTDWCGDQVFTSEPNGTFFNGTTRQFATGLICETGISAHGSSLTADDFHEVDEIFSSGNILKVVPVIGIEGCDIPAGAIARKARSLYRGWVHAEERA
ncbi:aminotransferase class IV [Granulosicoccus antarcticus]|uniref:Uncharacterized protein n=1 Tax=Granulosicoccus antarcticus IMCC3135 TaxID=1192854 RepID=A0A2Z2P8K0_9GAMM|nr:aminotransferase class IV [Granulosicoccus antarcticus]ASJ76194.1 hypothetical protein IMCC3135_30725 [Granulosicoccus antarcticus IMCC3135]